MTIESQIKLGGVIPVGPKREVKPGKTFSHSIGDTLWGLSTKYNVKESDVIVVTTEQRGLAVDSADHRRGKNELRSLHSDTLRGDEINKAQVGTPLRFAPGLIRVFTYKPNR